jgi:hypothetical protein
MNKYFFLKNLSKNSLLKNNLIFFFLRSNFYKFKFDILPKLSFFIEIYILRYLTKFFYFPYIIIENILIKKNMVLIGNLSESMGHTTFELHCLAKILKTKFKNKKFFLVYKNSDIVDTVFKIYKFKLKKIFYLKNTFLFWCLLPILYKNNKNLVLDVGAGKQSYDIKDNFVPQSFSKNKQKNIIYTGATKKNNKKFLLLIREFYNNSLSKNFYCSFFKYLRINDNDKKNFKKIGIKIKKTVLLHTNSREINANSKCLKPEIYIPLIRYLKKKKYQIIFIGRENFPKIFQKFNIINYANSNIASVKNDFKLFKMSNYSIISASGLSCLPRFMDKYYLYINSWHVHYNTESFRCVYLPVFLTKGKNINLNRQKQLRLNGKYLNKTDLQYMTRLNGQDLLNGFKELEVLKEKKYSVNKEQIFLNKKLLNSNSLISQNIIKKIPNRKKLFSDILSMDR